MSENRIVQIVPAFPPAISGVGDYAARLNLAGINLSTLVAGEQTEIGFQYGAAFLEERNSGSIDYALRNARGAVLHFSGYGYARRGLCQWLPDGLRAWKSRGGDRRLVTVFHEVYATGPIWRSSFWTAASQRRIAGELAQLSDFAFVTSDDGYNRLKVLSPRLPLEILPVFSNVEEPDTPALLKQRQPLAVVFGGLERRKCVYKSDQADMALALDRLEIEMILDIGPGGATPERFAGREVRRLGTLQPSEVSEWLKIAYAGLIDYPRHVITKSGIAAGYFAHAVLVINTNEIGELPDDLAEGREFVTPKGLALGELDLQAIATAGHAWYQPHGVAATWRRIEWALG